MSWYQVLIVLPGTDGDAENGFCEPQWWNEMVQAENELPAAENWGWGVRSAQAHRRLRTRSTTPG